MLYQFGYIPKLIATGCIIFQVKGHSPLFYNKYIYLVV